ncbi:class I adenylate-forming enzyme family protein [Aeromicrobium sp. A1-2]|uniref:class I adenylate-forming enzyme family protein n=1 Tax=Aeromicrobium sp. A1-2 TaxID=2107713 RepID=UPI0013C2C1B5|nr:AMP-binding protein [Aeromicrobium sp. A1-2]
MNAESWSAVDARTILDVLISAHESGPDEPALIYEDGVVVSRRDLFERVERFAGYLACKVEPGDRVAIMLPNRTEYMIAWFAAAACRATLVSINPAAKVHDAGHLVRDSDAKLAIIGEDGRSLFETIRSSCPSLKDVVVVEGSEPDGLDSVGSPGFSLVASAADAQRADITNIYYTSGTTGLPKGCMVDHEYWLRFVDLFQRRYGMGPEDRFLCCLQFFYNDPPWQLLLSLHAGSPLVVMRTFSVRRYWDVVREHRVTIVFGIAATAYFLLGGEPSKDDRNTKVRLGVQVGIVANTHQQLVERWGFPWVEGYGLTETGLIVSMPLDRAEEMVGSGSIGMPCGEVELRIVDHDDNDVAEGSIGQIIVRSPGMMRGYLNRPDETEATMRGGWLHTGDLGCIDDNGFVYFKGRQKDIIRRSGENVAAAEIEEVITVHPGVLEAAIVPVADDARGEEIKAVIVPTDGTESEGDLFKEIVELCLQQLAKYKVPRYFEIRREPFERTPSMRVKKDDLRNVLSEPPEMWDRESSMGW